MRELSLFTGAGGGLLGTMLLGFQPIGYVEWDDYCQRVIAARIRDGILPNAPIFGDIKTFISDGYAASYTGMVDVITGGFPCQPFSVAGKQKGADDERNQWPATATVIGIVKPRFVLLENVPGIRRYLPVVVRDLRLIGYEVSRPLILGADDVGAPHRRKRIWIVATNSTGYGLEGRRMAQQGSTRFPYGSGEIRPDGVYAPCERFGGGKRSEGQGDDGRRQEEAAPTERRGPCVADPLIEQRDRRGDGPSWWEREPLEALYDARRRGRQEDGLSIPESLLGRVANGVASRVDRLKALGNGQVSLCAAVAWKILSKMA